MRSISVGVSPCEKMGSVRILGILLVFSSDIPLCMGNIFIFWFGLEWPLYRGVSR